jgi:hypothetical protein
VEKRPRATGDDNSIVSGVTTFSQSTLRSHASIKSDMAAVPTHLWDERLGLNKERRGHAVILGG